MAEQTPTVEDALALGLTRAEYQLVCEKQGRAPNQVELAMYSLLWSEHCAYKHSKKLLRTLPTEGPHVVMGPGENAGAVDVGGGLVCAFKVESHNHPSAVEPFQGAATGVGGILRDIFAIGARPIAVLDSLRFGEVAVAGPAVAGAEQRGAVGPAGGGSPVEGAGQKGAAGPAGGGSPVEGAGQKGAAGPAGGGSPVEDAGQTGAADPAAERHAARSAERSGAFSFASTPSATRARYLLDGAVAGIAHYGNSIGVPTVGGEVYFEGPYEHNCLVNAMALGLAPRESLVRSAAAGPGNALVLFGASTGRDGIGGASVLASAELGIEEDKRPTVQVGDPFEEKKLMECSLELLARGLLVSLQDLGAAGLTSAAAEMASKGEVGLDIDVARVPLRQPGLAPFEIMVSESQERMLCVVAQEDVQAVLELCEKWEVGGSVIGTVTASERLRVFAGEQLVGDMPVRALVDDCPLYDLAPSPPAVPIYPAPPPVLAEGSGLAETLLALLASPNLSSRRALFEHYDAIVQSRTIRRPESADAAVLKLPDGTALAVSIDCNGRRVAADPYRGTVEAALECAANLACVGAEPLGTTNNLNFGNPEKPHIAWQLAEAVRGLGDACRALEAPIVGGNVSLYNEGPAGPIYPTPVVGMVGVLPDAAKAGRLGFAQDGDTIALVGPFVPSLQASELAKLWGRQLPQRLPSIDVGAVRAAQFAVRGAVRVGALSSAHDIAEGGLAVALAECCLAGGRGADVRLAGALAGEEDSADLFAALFGESPGGFLISGPPNGVRSLGRRTPVHIIGTVGGDALSIATGTEHLQVGLDELATAHGALADLFT